VIQLRGQVVADSIDVKKARYAELFRNALALIAGLIAIINGAAKAREYIDRYQSGNLDWFTALPPLILFVLTLEYALFERHYAKFAPDRPALAIITAILVPASIVLLAYFADKIEIYSIFFCIYAAVNIGVRWATTGLIAKLIVRAEKSVKAEVTAEFRLLYVKRPQQVLNFLLLVAGLVSLWLVHWSGLTPPAPVSATMLAYAVISLALVLNEAIIWSWRARLYRLVG
jgi:hypothetical protein